MSGHRPDLREPVPTETTNSPGIITGLRLALRLDGVSVNVRPNHLAPETMTSARKLIVGLTGGIGSGKSAVSALFEALGITVVDADVAARTVVEPGTPVLARIAEHFGPGVIGVDGALDRAALRRLVFADPQQRRWLEGVTHPAIGAEIQRGLREATGPYAMLVSPLLFEAKQDVLTDRVLVVDVSEQTQLERTMRRDANDEAQVRAIIAAQIDRAGRLARADDVIVNDGTLEELRAQVCALHERYLELAAAMTAATTSQ